MAILNDRIRLTGPLLEKPGFTAGLFYFIVISNNTMLRRILNSRSKTITAAAFILSVATLASRLLGLLREKLLAHYFGAGDVVDIYFAAFKIPDLIFLLLVSGILSSVFIPMFTNYWENKSEASAFDLANQTLNFLVLSIFILTVILFIFSPFLVKLIAPGFSPQKTESTLKLMRLLFLSPLLLGISNLFSFVLKSLRHFFIVSMAPILYNLGIILGIVIFYPLMGISGLVWGVILGSALHLLIQIPTLLASGWKYRPWLSLRSSSLVKMLKMTPMRSAHLLVNHLSTIVTTGIASTLAVGSVAVYNYASNLQGFAVAVFGLSFATAAFPALASLAAKKDWKWFCVNFSSTARQIMFFLIPASVFIFVLRAQIVRVILGSGAFDWAATIRTLDSLGWFSLSLAFQGLLLLLLRAFYALEDSKTPFWTALAAGLVNIILSFVLPRFMGVPGLALAFSLSSLLQILLLHWALRRCLPEIKSEDKNLFFSGLKIVFSSLIAGMSAYGFLYILDLFLDTHTGLGILSQGIISGSIGILIYIIFSLLLKSPELDLMVKLINKKIRGEMVKE